MADPVLILIRLNIVMCFSRLIWKSDRRQEAFLAAQDRVRALDFDGLESSHCQMYQQYQKRNSFGLEAQAKLYRIFQKDYYDRDVSDGFLTLPRASATIWEDPLENPLSHLIEADSVSSVPIHFGALVSSFYAMCWTKCPQATQSDWDNVSHGKTAIRISTTAEKLLNRIMCITDSAYMNRTWLIEVEYKRPCLIRRMQNIDELKNRMESTGALLALSAAVVRTEFSDENEVRLLYDNGLIPHRPGIAVTNSANLIRIPFDWSDLVESATIYPCTSTHITIDSTRRACRRFAPPGRR